MNIMTVKMTTIRGEEEGRERDFMGFETGQVVRYSLPRDR